MEFFIKTFSSIFIIMGPFSVIPIFITMTRDNTRSEKDAIIKKAIMATLGISLLFAVAGHFFLRMFGITIQSFQMAGGLLILLMSINMLHADRSKVRVTPEEQKEGIQKEDISVFPLAVPLISGPGTLSTLVLLANEASTPFHWFSIISSIIVSAMLIYLILKMSDRFYKILGETGINIVTRIMGLILASISFEFIFSGLRTFLSTVPWKIS